MDWGDGLVTHTRCNSWSQGVTDCSTDPPIPHPTRCTSRRTITSSSVVERGQSLRESIERERDRGQSLRLRSPAHRIAILAPTRDQATLAGLQTLSPSDPKFTGNNKYASRQPLLDPSNSPLHPTTTLANRVALIVLQRSSRLSPSVSATGLARVLSPSPDPPFTKARSPELTPMPEECTPELEFRTPGTPAYTYREMGALFCVFFFSFSNLIIFFYLLFSHSAIPIACAHLLSSFDPSPSNSQTNPFPLGTQ